MNKTSKIGVYVILLSAIFLVWYLYSDNRRLYGDNVRLQNTEFCSGFAQERFEALQKGQSITEVISQLGNPFDAKGVTKDNVATINGSNIISEQLSSYDYIILRYSRSRRSISTENFFAVYVYIRNGVIEKKESFSASD